MHRKLDREEQLQRLRGRYQGRGKQGRTRLLDDFCEQYGYERKYAIKLLRPPAVPQVVMRRPGPEPKYEGVSEVLTQVWQVAEQLCGKRLVRALPLWLPHYERHYGKLLPRQKKLLAEVSAATLDRLLAGRKRQLGKGKGGTKPGTLLRQQVPIQGKSGTKSGSAFWKPTAWRTVAPAWRATSSGV